MGRDKRHLEGLGFFSKKEVSTWKPNQHVTVWATPEGQDEPVLIWMASWFLICRVFFFFFMLPFHIPRLDNSTLSCAENLNLKWQGIHWVRTEQDLPTPIDV